MEDLISIIIPVYNAEPFLQRCMESIKMQTYQHFEVLFIDDGSADLSGQICDGYAKTDHRVRVVHQRNQGVSMARNRGLAEAGGQYIAFIDADDYIKSDYLEVLYRDITEIGADIACCNYMEFDRDEIYRVNRENHKLKVSGCGNGIRYYFDMLGKDSTPGVVWGKLIKSPFAKRHAFMKGQDFGEDTIYMFELFSEDPVIFLDDYTGYYYNRRTDSATKKTSKAAVSVQHIRVGETIIKYTARREENIRKAGVNEYAKRIYTALSYLIKENSHIHYRQYRQELVYHSRNVLKMCGMKPHYHAALFIYVRLPDVYWYMMSLLLKLKKKKTEQLEKV